MREREPWTINPDLTSDRLAAVAQLISRGRNDALDRYEPEIGDDSWSLGCRAFQCQRHQILMAHKIGLFDWLAVLDPSKHFVFRIGDVPMRFYRGPAEEPNLRTMYQSFPELAQFSLFESNSEAPEYAHRLAIETDVDGSIIAVRYVALYNGVPEFYWDIPLAGIVTPIRLVDAAPTEGVDLPTPQVRLPGEEGDQEGRIG